MAFPDPANPGQTTTTGALTGVSADGANDVWVAGTYYYTTAGCASCEQTFSLHWNGTSWAGVPMPPVDRSTDPSNSYVFRSVDVISPSDVWAAGHYTPSGASGPQTLTLFWNGTSWATVPSLHPGNSSALFSVSTVPGTATTWAVGDSTSTSGALRALSPLALKTANRVP